MLLDGVYSKSGNVVSETKTMSLSAGYQSSSRAMSLLSAGRTMSVVGIDDYLRSLPLIQILLLAEISETNKFVPEECSL